MISQDALIEFFFSLEIMIKHRVSEYNPNETASNTRQWYDEGTAREKKKISK